MKMMMIKTSTNDFLVATVYLFVQSFIHQTAAISFFPLLKYYGKTAKLEKANGKYEMFEKKRKPNDGVMIMMTFSPFFFPKNRSQKKNLFLTKFCEK